MWVGWILTVTAVVNLVDIPTAPVVAQKVVPATGIFASSEEPELAAIEADATAIADTAATSSEDSGKETPVMEAAAAIVEPVMPVAPSKKGKA